MKRIPVAGPSITQHEIDAVRDAVTTAWYGDANKYHERFERRFAEYVGRKYAMALPSCTSAIHLALAALNIGPGDEVIVPESTWIATSAPIAYVGATPVFADVDPVTWCLSPESFRAHLTPNTKAVIPVDIYGSVCNYSVIEAIAAEANVAIVEDAAEAVGASLNGRRAGSFGAASVFSFHGSKTLTTGEGGMLVTDDEELFRRASILRDHGRRPGDRAFYNAEVAFKYKMSSMQAALGLAQLERIEELIDRKREAFAWYREALKDVEGIALNAEPPGARHVYWMVTAVFDPQLGLFKERLAEELNAAGIDTRPFFHPLSSLPAYASSPQATSGRTENPVSYRLGAHGINLPSSLSLTRDEVRYVAETLRAIVARAAVNIAAAF